MSKEEFTHHEIRMTSPDWPEIRTVRCRNSAGDAWIELHVGLQKMTFRNTPEGMGDFYEAMAHEAGTLLKTATYDGCELPKAETND